MQHGCEAQVPAVLPDDKTGSSSLDPFELVDVVFDMRVPDCGGIFHDRTDHGLAAQCCDICRATAHAPQKECKWCLLCDMR